MTDADVAIVGAGPSGLALALALADSGHHILVCDARPRDAVARDARVLALAHGSRLILEHLGVWQTLDVTPIDTIHVSQRGGFGRSLLRASELDVPALGYVTAAGPLTAALRRAVEAAGIEVRDETTVDDGQSATDIATLQLRTTDGGTTPLATRLVVRAEGGPGDGADVSVRDYGQHALISLARPEGGHHNIAFERFTPQGPIALLPFGSDYAVVHVADAATIDSLSGLDDSNYLDQLQQGIGRRVQLAAIGARSAFPLALRVRREAVAPRMAWLGNAAQTLHPVAGQGFNLALRDVHTLARALRDAADPGAADLLAAWARGRRLDRSGTIGFTDGLIRLFANDSAPLRLLRGAGLFALDLCPPARSFVARRMMFGARAWP